MTCRGTYFSEQSIAGHAVEVELTKGGALILRGLELEVWIEPKSFQWARPLPGIPLFVRLANEEWLEIPASERPRSEASGFVAPASFGSRALGLLERHLAWTTSLTVVLTVGLSAAIYTALPRLAHRVAFAVPSQLEKRIGDATLAPFAQVTQASDVSRADQIRLYRQLDRLQKARALHIRPRLMFEPLGQPNAFALPGGTIVVTDQLMQLNLTGDELAAILAHELGHEEERHGVQKVLTSSLALLTVSAITGDLSTLTHFSAALPSLLVNSGYSRDFERQADLYAVGLLNQAEIDPTALAHALKKLQAAADSNKSPAIAGGYFSTHPATTDRIASIESAARRAKPPVLSPAKATAAYYTEVGRAYVQHDKKQYADETDSYRAAFRIRPGTTRDLYDGACAAALSGQLGLARSWLEPVAHKGWYDPDHLLNDPDLRALHGDDWWKTFAVAVKQRSEESAAAYEKDLQTKLLNLRAGNEFAQHAAETNLKKFGSQSLEYNFAEQMVKAANAADIAVVQDILRHDGWAGVDRVGIPAGYVIADSLDRADLQIKKASVVELQHEAELHGLQISAIAHLTDQIAMADRERQIYGTQVLRDAKTGRYYLPSIEEPATVELRRAQVGLGPLSSYLAHWSIYWDPDNYESLGSAAHFGGSSVIWSSRGQ